MESSTSTTKNDISALEAVTEKDRCPICLDDFDEIQCEILKLSCNHRICLPCLVKLKKFVYAVCPLCRQKSRIVLSIMAALKPLVNVHFNHEEAIKQYISLLMSKATVGWKKLDFKILVLGAPKTRSKSSILF